MRKTAILAVLSIASSLFFISMITVINISPFWLSMDTIITITCIILLFKRNDPVFDVCSFNKYSTLSILSMIYISSIC